MVARSPATLVAILTAAAVCGCAPEPPGAGREAPSHTAAAAELLPAHPGYFTAGVLSGGEARDYSIELPEDTAIEVSAGQHGIDLELRIAGPGGEQVTRVDSPTGTRGRERAFWVSESAGLHAIRIEAFGGGRGGYYLRVDRLRPATPADRELAAAALALDRAEHLRLTGPESACHAAEPEYRRALAVLEAVPIDLEREARAQLGLAYCLGEVGDPEEAAERFQRAGVLFAEAGLMTDRAWALRDLGRMLQRVSKPRQALRALDRSVALFGQLGDAAGEGWALHTRAELALATSSFEEAHADLDRALGLFRAEGAARGEAAALSTLGRLYTLIGFTEEALDPLRRAAALQRAAGDDAGRRNTVLAIGWVHYLDLDPADALPYYAEALALAGAQDDLGAEAGILDRLGSALRKLGAIEEAEAAFRASLTRSRRLGRPAEEGGTLANLGRLMLARGEVEAAVPLLDESIGLLRAAGDRNSATAPEVDRARADRLLGRPDAALERLERVIAELADLREGLQGDLPRGLFLAQRRAPVEEAVDLLFELGRVRQDERYVRRALEIAEQARARGLLEGLAGAGLGLTSTDPAAVAAFRDLSRRLGEAEAERRELVAAGASAERISASEARMRALTLEHDRARGALRRVAEDLLPPPLTADDIQALADPETALLIYLLAEPRSFLWVVDPATVEGFILPGRERIEAHAQTASRLLEASSHPVARAQVPYAAARLTEDVLRPAAGKLTARRLAVLPDGALHAVPFGVLPEPDPASPGAVGPPLLHRHEVVVLPSAAVLALQRRLLATRPRAPRKLAVLADPVYRADDPRLDGRGDRTPAPPGSAERTSTLRGLDLDRLDRLEHSREEAEALAALVPEDQRLVALDFEASRDLALSGVLGEYEMVHVAGHGFLDDDHPALSGVALSLYDEDGRPRDGFLRAHELRELDLAADLVVLSACRTGLGRRLAGEGVLGVTRGLLLGGARRAVVSQWDVDDRATAELMERFYTAMLRDGLPAPAALRQAGLSMAADPRWSAPAYWAAFTLHGDWR